MPNAQWFVTSPGQIERHPFPEEKVFAGIIDVGDRLPHIADLISPKILEESQARNQSHTSAVSSPFVFVVTVKCRWLK